MQYKKISDINLKDKIVFIRSDMNVPINDGQIRDDTRIKASITTIKYALDHGAKVIVATHLGRPQEGKCNENDRVKLIAKRLAQLLNLPVPVISDLNTAPDFSSTKIVMLENVRCNIGEMENDDKLGLLYASLCDVFVHDAFATAHRAQASTDAIGRHTKEVCAGLLLSAELKALTQVTNNPKAPIIAIVAGSKVSTKLAILNNLADKVDYLIVGGGILNTFLAAKGHNVGKSLVETELYKESQQIMAKMQARGASVPLPEDVIVTKEFSPNAVATEKRINELTNENMILDIGTTFALTLSRIIKEAGTIIWNGPVGVFEFDQFSHGTEIIGRAIAESHGFSLAGGGDTIAALNKFGLFDKMSYVSTAGGALLEFLEGKELPALKLLSDRSANLATH